MHVADMTREEVVGWIAYLDGPNPRSYGPPGGYVAEEQQGWDLRDCRDRLAELDDAAQVAALERQDQHYREHPRSAAQDRIDEAGEDA